MREGKQLARRVFYVYAITPGDGALSLSSPGVDGRSRVQTIPCAGLVCWVSRVSRSEFAGSLERNMQNLEWLAAAGVRHQRVVAEIARQSAVLPARFGTVFLSQSSLKNDVRKRKRALLAAFKRIADADEWGVKVFGLPRPAAAVVAHSGKDYLRQKAARLQSRQQRLPEKEIQSFARTLAGIARASAPAGKVSAGQPNLEWQASFLLPRRRRRRWEAALKRFADRWRHVRRIECSGPWPPYSFVAHAG